MSGEISRSYDGPDDRDTKALVRDFMAEQARSLEAAGYCAAHALPRESCSLCAAKTPREIVLHAPEEPLDPGETRP